MRKLSLQQGDPHQAYHQALTAFESGSRKSKPYPSDFGIVSTEAPPISTMKPAGKSLPPLLPQQVGGMHFLMEHKGNGVLFHMVGAGKTRSSVETADELMRRGLAKKVLVVTPGSLRANFAQEGVHRYSSNSVSVMGPKGEPGSRSIHDPDPHADYHVVSYDMFRKDPHGILQRTGADTMILDELHRVKDPSGATYDAVQDAAKKVKHVIGLTGSFVSTHPANILQPINVVSRGQHNLGNTQEFSKRYIKYDTPPQTWAQWLQGKQPVKGEISGWQNTEELGKELRKYVHYAGPESVEGQMPKKNVETIRVEMSPVQEQLYRAALHELPPPILKKIEQGEALKPDEEGKIFNRLIHARQAANSLHTFGDKTGLSLSDAAASTPKLQKMLDDVEDHIDRTPDHQVVIYTNLIHGGTDIISEGLKQRGIAFGTFTGKGNEGVTEEKRQKDVQDFKDGKKKVIVLSGAGSEGISFPNATAMYSYDGHFNPERVLQAEARAVRTGGQAHRAPEDRQVEVKRYMTVYPENKSLFGKAKAYFTGQQASDAVDEWIYSRAERRHRINTMLRDIFQGKENPTGESLFPEGQLRKASAELVRVSLGLEKVADAVSNRAAHRLGRAARDVTHPFTHVDASSKIEALKLRTQQLAGNLTDLVQPLTAEDKKRFAKGDEKSWFLRGKDPWSHASPTGEAAIKQKRWPKYLDHLNHKAADDNRLVRDSSGNTYTLKALAKKYADEILEAARKVKEADALHDQQPHEHHVHDRQLLRRGQPPIATAGPVRDVHEPGAKVASRRAPADRAGSGVQGMASALPVGELGRPQVLPHQHVLGTRHVEKVGAYADSLRVVLHPGDGFARARARMVADMVLDSLVEIPEVKTASILQENGTLLVQAELRRPTEANTVRRLLKEALDPVLAEDRKTTLGTQGPGQLRLGAVAHYLDRARHRDATMEPSGSSDTTPRLANRGSDLMTDEFTHWGDEPNLARLRY